VEGVTTLCSVAGTAAPQRRQVKVGVAHTELAVPDVCQVGHIVAESVLLPTEAVREKSVVPARVPDTVVCLAPP